MNLFALYQNFPFLALSSICDFFCTFAALVGSMSFFKEARIEWNFVDC